MTPNEQPEMIWIWKFTDEEGQTRNVWSAVKPEFHKNVSSLKMISTRVPNERGDVEAHAIGLAVGAPDQIARYENMRLAEKLELWIKYSNQLFAVIGRLCEDRVISVRGSNDAPGFDACVKEEIILALKDNSNG